MANDKKGGARSWKSEVINDSFSVTLNFKWLLQIIAGTAIVVYFFWRMESRIVDLERNMDIALQEIELHEQERQIAEEKHIKDLELQMQEQTVWIEKELGINLNPFSWGKKKN